ncbi:MAG: hypothetical protein U0996_22760 [Planctomycetaceae bacterium]
MLSTTIAKIQKTLHFCQTRLCRSSLRRCRVSVPQQLESLEVRSLLTAGWSTSMQSALVSDMDGDAAGNHVFTGTLLYSADPATFGSITLPAVTNREIFVAKQNAAGQFLWAVTAGNATGDNDWSNNISLDINGDVVITGSFDGTAKFGSTTLTSLGGTDGFVAKLNGSTGQFLWARSIGGSLNDSGNGIAVDGDRNVVVSGVLDQATGSGNSDFWNGQTVYVSKFAADGSSVWTQSASGTMSGSLQSLAIDSSGMIYAAGRFQGTLELPTGTLVSTAYLPSPFGSPVADGLLTKLDTAGNFVWARSLSGDSSNIVTDVAIGPDQQLYISGKFEGTSVLDGTTITSTGYTDFYVAKASSSTGAVSWAQRMGGTDKELYGGDLAFDLLGNVKIAGTFRGTASFGSQILTTDGGVENAFVATLTSSGAFIETDRVVTGTFSAGINIVVPLRGLHIDAAGNTFVAGWFAGATIQTPQKSLTGNYGAGYMIMLPPSAPTKFFVVNDSSYDRTFQYAPSGELTIDNFSLNTGNTAPRGAASTAAGTKVWVADANRNVYVYSASGTRLGSWSAANLSSTAQVEGITTNGSDVWILDNKTDRVYRYNSAANTLGGSLSASSSFSLNSTNSNAKGLVTDGTSIWVINDSTTDKIFKYSLSGTLLGSWTIDAANSSPTGLTIDPSNVSNIWTVDSGTRKIYQYNAAASRTSGTQTAAASYPLAAGNTNPQDIADPPISMAAAESEPLISNEQTKVVTSRRKDNTMEGQGIARAELRFRPLTESASTGRSVAQHASREGITQKLPASKSRKAPVSHELSVHQPELESISSTHQRPALPIHAQLDELFVQWESPSLTL